MTLDGATCERPPESAAGTQRVSGTVAATATAMAAPGPAHPSGSEVSLGVP